jgi:hypothetical protein
MRRPLAALLLHFLFASTAFAQDTVKYAKSTTLNFEDDAIDGALTKPDGEHVTAREKVKHSKLIRVRTDFKRRSLETLGAVR